MDWLKPLRSLINQAKGIFFPALPAMNGWANRKDFLFSRPAINNRSSRSCCIFPLAKPLMAGEMEDIAAPHFFNSPAIHGWGGRGQIPQSRSRGFYVGLSQPSSLWKLAT